MTIETNCNTEVEKMVKISELCFDVGNGQIVVKKNNDLEFNDVINISMQEMEFIIREARNFIEIREQQNTKAPEHKEEKPEVKNEEGKDE